MKRLVFDLMKIPFLKRLIGISRLIIEVLNDHNLFAESNLVDWFSRYVQFCSGGHFSERAELLGRVKKSRHMAPVQNRDQFAMQTRNKCFLMKIDKHLEYLNTRTVLKLVLGLYLQSFRAFRVVLL